MTIPAGVIRKYRENANVFIETGSHTGASTEVARRVGFSKIYTIELSPNWYRHCVKKFAAAPNVKCIFGDSTQKLPEILKELAEPAVFWLDGHWSQGDTAKGDKAVPLYEELEAIAQHSIKTHTLLIDDVRLMGGIEWPDILQSKVKELCLKINPDYNFSYENGFVPNDILVATV